MEVKEKPKASSLPSGKLVEVYIELRDRRARRKAAFENEDSEDKGKQEKIEGMLLQRFNADGIDSVKTPFGTAYTTTRTTASVADKEVFMSWADAQDDRWEYIEVRADKKNVEAYREANDDLPPGINWTESRVINVRRS